jgi:hypothetical protein
LPPPKTPLPEGEKNKKTTDIQYIWREKRIEVKEKKKKKESRRHAKQDTSSR